MANKTHFFLFKLMQFIVIIIINNKVFLASVNLQWNLCRTYINPCCISLSIYVSLAVCRVNFLMYSGCNISNHILKGSIIHFIVPTRHNQYCSVLEKWCSCMEPTHTQASVPLAFHTTRRHYVTSWPQEYHYQVFK